MNSNNNGFTLIELMITMLVIAILTAIAYPSYQEHLRKTRRAECAAVLTSTAASLERRRAVAGVYNGFVPSSCPVTGEPKFYDVSISPPDYSNDFTITATPRGAQASDKCGELTLTHTGQTGVSKSTVGACWR